MLPNTMPKGTKEKVDAIYLESKSEKAPEQKEKNIKNKLWVCETQDWTFWMFFKQRLSKKVEGGGEENCTEVLSVLFLFMVYMLTAGLRRGCYVMGKWKINT